MEKSLQTSGFSNSNIVSLEEIFSEQVLEISDSESERSGGKCLIINVLKSTHLTLVASVAQS